MNKHLPTLDRTPFNIDMMTPVIRLSNTSKIKGLQYFFT